MNSCNSKYHQIQSFNELNLSIWVYFWISCPQRFQCAKIRLHRCLWWMFVRRFMLVSTLLMMKMLGINLRCWVNITGNRFFTSKRSSAFRCHPHQCGLQISNEVLDEGRAYFRHFWPISDLFSLTISAITGHLLFNIQLSYSMVILYNLYMSLLPIKSVCSYIIAYKNSYLALNWAWLL